MKEQRSRTYGKQYQAVQQVIEGQQKLSFTCNLVFLATALLFFLQLYWAFTRKRAQYFVYTSLAIDIAYPFLLMAKNRELSLKIILLQGTSLSSIVYSCWTLAYPHKVFIYYIPQYLGGVTKLYQQISGDCSQDVADTIESMVKFQAKIEGLVLVYTLASFLIRFKFGWPRLLKVLLLGAILKLKYWQHYGTQLAWEQIHNFLDQVSKHLLVRQHYQEFYSIFSRLGNAYNQRQLIIL